LRPERLQSRSRDGPALGEEIAQAQQISRLQGVRLIPEHRFEGRNGFEKFVLTVIRQPDIEPYACPLCLWDEALGFFEFWQGLGPLLAEHVDDAEIGIGGAGLRIEAKNLAKIALRFVEAIVRESIFAAMKKLRWIGRFSSGTGDLIGRAGRGLARGDSERRPQEY